MFVFETKTVVFPLKRHNSVKNVGGVTILNLCTSSDCALYLYEVL